MVKTTGGPPGGHIPTHIPMERTDGGLNQKEATKAKDTRSSKLSSADAARVAQQAGFQRLKKSDKKGGFDIGDGSGQQFSLPEEDTDGEAWSAERLADAQGSMSMAAAQFGQVASGAKEGMSLGAALLSSNFSATDEDIAQMEDLAKRSPPEVVPAFEEVSSSVQKLFGIALGDDVPVGQKVLAAGLVVAGEPSSVQVDQGKLKEDGLASGVQKVTKRGNQAVDEAQRMSKGINEKLNLQRTFVFKR